MGQQQLLLIVLSVIIVGIAIVVGINMFSSSAAAANQDAVINDGVDLASRAYQWCIKPTGMGGGGGDYTGNGTTLIMSMIEPTAIGAAAYTNANGSYVLTSAVAGLATFTCDGTTPDKNGSTCKVIVTVTDKGVIATVVQTRVTHS